MTYLKSEMGWYVNFMTYQAQQCEEKAEANKKLGLLGSGHELREADMWRRLAREARMKFGWEKQVHAVKKEEPSDSDIENDEEEVDGDFDTD